MGTGRRRVHGWSRVAASAGQLAHPHQVHHQPQAVPQGPHGGPLRVLDLDRNLRQGQPPALGEVEQLHVEGEAVQGRGLEQPMGHVGPKCLQATLGIPVLAQQQCVGRQVHQPSTHLAEAPGPDQGPGVGVASAPDHHVVAGLYLDDQGRGLGRPVGQVGVGEDHGPPGGHGHPGTHGSTLSGVALQAHHPVGAGGLSP